MVDSCYFWWQTLGQLRSLWQSFLDCQPRGRAPKGDISSLQLHQYRFTLVIKLCMVMHIRVWQVFRRLTAPQNPRCGTPGRKRLIHIYSVWCTAGSLFGRLIQLGVMEDYRDSSTAASPRGRASAPTNFGPLYVLIQFDLEDKIWHCNPDEGGASFLGVDSFLTQGVPVFKGYHYLHQHCLTQSHKVGTLLQLGIEKVHGCNLAPKPEGLELKGAKKFLIHITLSQFYAELSLLAA